MFCGVKYDAIEQIFGKNELDFGFLKWISELIFHNSLISKGYPLNLDVNIAFVKIDHLNV